MGSSHYYNRAYILSLIRERQQLSWNDLCRLLGMPPDERLTAFTMVFESLKELVRAGLITSSLPLPENGFGFDGDGFIFFLSPSFAAIQRALQISLTELAASDADKRMIVTPLFNRLFSTKFQSQLLVLMPFAEDLRPVYDDHLKSVAARVTDDHSACR